MPSCLVRAVSAVVLVAGLLFASAAPASAHSAGGGEPTDYRSTLRLVEPNPGIDVQIIELGNFLQITNDQQTELMVLGYQNEPYVRIGPDGVFENRKSPATYLNAPASGVGTVAADADVNAEPVWEKVSDEPVARIHDHRIHWMKGSDLGKIPGLEGRETNVRDWTVSAVYDGVPVTMSGTLEYVPGPSSLPWVVAAVVLGVASLLAGLRKRAGVSAALAIALVVADALHVIGLAWFGDDDFGQKLLRFFDWNYYVVAIWPIGVLAALKLRGDKPSGPYLGIFTGLFVAFIGGFSDIATLYSSQIPYAFGDLLARAVVAISLGFGIALTVLSVIELRKTGSLKPIELPKEPEA